MAEYIDRQAVLDELDEDIEEFVECDYALKFTKRYIKKIPPADVRPVVHGEWVDYDDDYGALCCSVCEHDAPEDTRWPFCPYCGADMREDKT